MTIEKKHYIDTKLKVANGRKKYRYSDVSKSRQNVPKNSKKYLDGANQSHITFDLLFHVSKANIPYFIVAGTGNLANLGVALPVDNFEHLCLYRVINSNLED